MNKETLWGLLIQNNPRLTDDPHLTPESARRFFDTVWNTAYGAGCKDMVERQREISQARPDPKPESLPEELPEELPKEFIKFLIAAINDELGEDENPKKKKH